MEFLETHLSPNKDEQNDLPQNVITMGSPAAAEYKMNKGTNKTGAEKSRSNSAPACLGPEMEFPFISKISIESQKLFFKVFETLRSGQLANVDLQEMKAVQVCDCITDKLQTFQPSQFDRETHDLGCQLTHGQGTAKNTPKQIIYRCCFYLTHIFEVSRFEVLISRFFWAFFQNLLICM